MSNNNLHLHTHHLWPHTLFTLALEIHMGISISQNLPKYSCSYRRVTLTTAVGRILLID